MWLAAKVERETVIIQAYNLEHEPKQYERMISSPLERSSM